MIPSLRLLILLSLRRLVLRAPMLYWFLLDVLAVHLSCFTTRCYGRRCPYDLQSLRFHRSMFSPTAYGWSDIYISGQISWLFYFYFGILCTFVFSQARQDPCCRYPFPRWIFRGNSMVFFPPITRQCQVGSCTHFPLPFDWIVSIFGLLLFPQLGFPLVPVVYMYIWWGV